MDGQVYVKVRVQNEDGGNLTWFVQEDKAFSLKISDEKFHHLPKKQTGRKFISNREFLDHAIPDINIGDLTVNSRCECAIVGRLGVLKSEVKEECFGVAIQDGGFVAGSLQDILRIRQFLVREEAYCSVVLKYIGEDIPEFENGEEPYVTIFDGASGYLRTRDNFRNPHSIVVLDRTEPLFQEGATAVDGDYLKRAGDGNIDELVAPPTGVEMVFFEEDRW